MSIATRPATADDVIYPDSDGEPMSDNTLQFEWIVTLQGNLDALFADRPDVFVAGDLLWYPVQGNNKIRSAPDAMVVLGRPKGYRGSYKQWVEGGIAPQVAFEVLSPGNRVGKMLKKFRFYERFGVEEYYIYDPDDFELSGWLRDGATLEEIPEMAGWISPRLGIRFEPRPGGLEIYRPDGRPFETYLELHRKREEAERQIEQAHREVEQAHREAEQAHREAERLKVLLRELGVDPDA